jgi:hypothetical protein
VRAFVLGLVVSAAVVAVGCGGDDEDKREDFFIQGNRICARLDQKVEAIERDAFRRLRPGQEASPRLYTRFAKKAAPQVSAGINQLTRLSPPEGDERQVRAIYAELRKGSRALSRAATDRQAAKAFLKGEGEGPFARASALTDEYGLVECSEEYNGRRD